MFSRKKETPLDKRIKELRKEMEKLDQELKSLQHTDKVKVAVSSTISSSIPPHSQQQTAIQTSEIQPPYTNQVATQKSPSTNLQPQPSRSGNDLFSYAERKKSFFTKGVQAEEEEKHKREKFVHYFMAGHFQNLKPLRQEQRILRNKVIMVLIAIVLLTAWLLYYFYIM